MKRLPTFSMFFTVLFLLGLQLSFISCSKEKNSTAAVNPPTGDGSGSNKSAYSVKLIMNDLTASAASSGYAVANSVDGNISTRWTASGTVYLYADLGTSQLIDYVKIAHYLGDSRQYTMQMHVRNTTTEAWTLVGTKTSPGNTTGLADYDLANSTSRFIRITCTGNSVDANSNITEFEVWGTLPATASATAKTILGGLTNWKLNAYSGNLNVTATDNALTFLDSAPKDDNFSWFYSSGGYAYFKVYPGNPTSSGSSNPRTELREMNASGSSAYNWDGTGSTEHKMKWKLRIDQLPASGKLCFGQIHSTSSTFDDLIRVQVQGSSGQTSGTVTLRIMGYATETLLGGGLSISGFTFNLNTEYYFELAMQNKVIKLYSLDAAGNRVSTLFTSGQINSNSNYFKAGNYSQSTSGSDYNSSVFGLVGISYIVTSH